MAIPSRKNRMMQKIIKSQGQDKEKLKATFENKEIDKEEHEKRLELLKQIGLIK